MSAQNLNPKPNPAKNQKDQLDASKNLKDRAQANNPDTKAKKEASGAKKESRGLPKKDQFQGFLNLGFKHKQLFQGYLDGYSLGKLRAVSRRHRNLVSNQMWAFYLLDFVLHNKESQVMAILNHLGLRLNPEDFEAILLKTNGQEKYFGFTTKRPQVKTNWFGISPLQAAFLTGNIKLGRILLDSLPDQFLDRAKIQIEEVTRNPEVSKTNRDKASGQSFPKVSPQAMPQDKDAKEKASALIPAAPKTPQVQGPTPPAVTAKNDDFLAFYHATIKANKDFYMAHDANEALPSSQREINRYKLKPLWQARGRAQRLLPEHGLERLLDTTPNSAWVKGNNEFEEKANSSSLTLTNHLVKQQIASHLQYCIREHRRQNQVPKTLAVHLQYIGDHESYPLDLEYIGYENYVALARQPEGGSQATRVHDKRPVQLETAANLATAARIEAQGLEVFCHKAIEETKSIIDTLVALDIMWKEFNESQSKLQTELQKAKTLPETSLALAHHQSKTEKAAEDKLGGEQSNNGKKENPKKPLVFNRNHKFNTEPLPHADPSLQTAVSLAVSNVRTKGGWWPF